MPGTRRSLLVSIPQPTSVPLLVSALRLVPARMLASLLLLRDRLESSLLEQQMPLLSELDSGLRSLARLRSPPRRGQLPSRLMEQ